MKFICSFFKWLFYLDGVEWWRIPRREHYKSSKTPFQEHLEVQEACEHQFFNVRHDYGYGNEWECFKCGLVEDHCNHIFEYKGNRTWQCPKCWKITSKPPQTPFQQHLEAQKACEHQFTRVENYWGDSWACSKCGKPMEESDWYDR